MFFGQCEPHGRRQSASLLWMLVWKRSMAWMGFVPSGSGMGMLLGSRTATPRCSIVVRFDAHAWWPVLGGWSDRVARGGLRTG